MRGNGRIFARKNSSHLWCAYYLRNKEYRESTKTSDPKKAARFLKRRTEEVGADKIGARPFAGPRQERLTIDELLDALRNDYELRGKATQQFCSHLKRLRAHFGAMRATQLSSETVDLYVKEQLDNGYKPATVNRRMQPLKQAYALAIERKHLHSAPSIRHLSEDNVRQGYFEGGEFRRLVSLLPEYLQDFALYAYCTGWCKNGIANLRWEQVSQEVIFLPAKYWKNRKPQTIPIAGEIADIVARRRAARAVTTKDGVTLSEFLFHRDGKPIGDIRKAWKTACELAGIPGRLFHDLCRTFARNADRAGVKRSVAMECRGRKTESIYLRYRIVDEGEKADALVQVQEYLRNEPSERDRAVPSRVQ